MRRTEQNPRDLATRIAVVGPASELATALRQLPNTPDVREFDDLFESATAIAEFRPAALAFPHRPSFEQDLGGVRILRALLPDLAIVVFGGTGALDPDCRARCTANEIHVLATDLGPPEVARVFARVLTDSAGPASYLQFVQGICDEINNPLMFAAGHLRLLESRLGADADPAVLAQVAAVRQGLDRIRGTMAKVGTMGRATRLERQHQPFRVAALIETTERQLQAAELVARFECHQTTRELVLEGDLDLLAGALFGLCQVGCELSEDATPVALQLQGSTAGIDLRMPVHNPRLEAWELPRAFEPYRLNDILRGTSLGLNLFLVRLVTRAHGWDAFARRLPDRSVEFCIGAVAAGD